MIYLLLACSGSEPKESSTTNVDSSDSEADSSADSQSTDTGDNQTTCGQDVQPPESQDTGNGPVSARDLTGSITWTLDFDATAEATGLKDCSYTRVYSGTERIDQQYLCPDCSLLVPAEANMTAGYSDCYLQIDDKDQIHTEMIGIADVGGELHFFRNSTQNVSPHDMGVITGDASAFSVYYSDTSDLSAGGQMLLSLAGDFTTVVGQTQLEDPEGAHTGTYACGWPHNNPGGANSSYTLADGEIFPNVRLEDQCGERVDLWDFRGYYLVVDVSALNCGYCQVMAKGAEAFKARMEEACIPVEMVTLMAESLSTINIPADLASRQAWATTYGVNSPILADEGFGYALLPAYLGEDSMGYPTTAVLNPEGQLIGVMDGFPTYTDDSGNVTGDGWDDIEAMIQADRGQ